MKRSASWAIGLLLLASAAFGESDSTGIRLLRQGRWQKAQSFYESAVQRNEGDPELHYQLAWALLRQGKFDDAADAIDKALDINENVSKYHYMRGAILGEKATRANVFSQGLLAPKIKNAFRRAIELDPNNIDGHIGLFNYYMRAPGIMGGSEEKGMEEARTVVRLNAYRGHQMLAGYYDRKKDAANAEAEYQKMIAADPKNADGRFRYGMFLVDQKQNDRAKAQFDKIMEIDPKSPESNYMYGRGMFNMDQWDKAMEMFRYVLSVEKNDPGAIWMLANCYEKKGMAAKAKETYQWLLTVEPEGRRAERAKEKLKALN